MKHKRLKMDLNSAYGAAMIKSKEYKNLRKVLDSGFATSYVDRLSDYELISQIFYYSGRALQGRNYERAEDLMTLHYLILEYANRYEEGE